MTKILGYMAVIFSAIVMGYGEGSIIALQFRYNLTKVVPPLLIYLSGTVSYLIGLFILADRIGSVIGIWETIAIGVSIMTAVATITKNGETIHVTPEMIFWGVILVIGVLCVIVGGDKFMSFFLQE